MVRSATEGLLRGLLSRLKSEDVPEAVARRLITAGSVCPGIARASRAFAGPSKILAKKGERMRNSGRPA